MAQGVLPVLILLGVLATTAVLIMGIFMMVRGSSETNPERSNKLMQARIWGQGITILIALVFLVFAAGGD